MLDSFITIISGPPIEKTKDPLYTRAKNKLKKILSEAEQIDQIINSIEQLEKMLQLLSDASLTIGNDLSKNFSDAPEQEKLRAQTNLNITKHFSALTNNFLIPRIDKNVIDSLSRIKEKANKLAVVKEYVKQFRQEFDLSRAVVKNYEINQHYKKDDEIMKNAIIKMNKDKENYLDINKKFINSVNKLKKRKKTIFDVPLKNMICLMSQYMMLVFNEIQKYRTTYPPDLFVSKNA